MKSPEILFAVATLTPVGLLAAGGFWGGAWIIAALAYLTVFAFAVDELAGVAARASTPDREFPLADGLCAGLAILHFPLLALAVFALTGGTELSGTEKTAAFFAFGLFFGQVSNANAHELIHRSRAPLYQLGKWVFISHLFGHHNSAHRLVHHRYVGTDRDPNSAPLGMGFYSFVGRAWVGSFRAGLSAENRVRRAAEGNWQHPYFVYLSGAIIILVLAAMIGGWAGVLCHIGLASYATLQLLLSDYVQHYGLRRRALGGGKTEAVTQAHSWNAPQRFSSLLLLNAPRHSDHHAHPGRAFPALGLADGVPTLPHSLAVMGMIALLPWRWRRIMDRKVAVLDA